MSDGLNKGGLVRRRLAAAGALALLGGCGGGNTERDVDAVLPTLQVSSDTPGQATGPFTVRFTFSAAVSNFSTSRVSVTNGFASATLTQLSDTVYTLVVTPTANFVGVGEVRLAAGAFQDATATVSSTVAYSFGQQIDTVVVGTEPVLTISHNVTAATATAPVTFTFSFSADVGDSFTATDIQPSVGTVTSFTRSSGTLYTAIVTLPAGTAGQLVVSVDAGAFQTTAGVASLQAYSKLVPFAIAA